MVETLIVYAVVAAAGAWTAWSLLLRGMFRRRAAGKTTAGCGPDCACGD